MVSLSNYQLIWSSAKQGPGALPPGMERAEACAGAPGDKAATPPLTCELDAAEVTQQFVFTTEGGTDTPEDSLSSLPRVRSVQDLLDLISVEEKSLTLLLSNLAVGVIAVLLGNLAAGGQWLHLFVLTGAGLLAALRATWFGAAGVVTVSACMFWDTLRSVWSGMVSADWLITMFTIVLVALVLFKCFRDSGQEDPRSHVLLMEQPSSHAVIRNDCLSDVKLLVFDGTDICRLVPYGGLFGGTRVPRGASCCVGTSPPYIVKVYAPFERELGIFRP
jgi:hypothetical protein